MNDTQQQQKIHVAAAVFLLISITYAAGLGLGSIFIVVGSLLGGVLFAKWIFECSNGELLYQWKDYFNQNVTSSEPPEEDDAITDTEKTRRMPWQGLTLPSSLNEAVENLLNEIVEQYVSGWYEGAISRDRAFINEIKYQLRYASANLVRCIRRVDLSRFVADTALPISSFHVSRLTELEQKLRSSLNAPPRSLLESKIAEQLDDVHVALKGREEETDYVRQISDFLIPRLLDETRLAGRAHDDDSPLRLFGRGKNERPWPSKSVRSFLKEMMTNAVLLPVFDMLTQPDTINYWLILLFDEDRKVELIEELVDTTPVPILKGLCDDSIACSSANLPDSLLQLKLTEILRDARLYSIFRMYLQDVRGPVHELQFLVEATRILDSIHRKSESDSQIAYDIWQLFGQFVHESAQERVRLNEKLVEQYKNAVEVNDLTVLETIIESSYQEVYNRTQSTHVVSFCQSECFLGYLCGSPPITINELIDQKERQKIAAPVERTFSLSQLRARVRRALTTAEEEKDEVGGNGVETPESPAGSSPSSYVSIPVPSIDIITSDGNVEEEEEVVATTIPIPTNPGLVMDSEPIDLNCWKVIVSQVSGLRDRLTDIIVYVFIIEVERPDAKPHETQKWSIHRSFNEFYVLESKLNEFHGDSIRFSPLPTRKTFVTRDKPFMEQHRLIFSTFISTLCKQRLLNRSELLLAFLSSNDEFRDTLSLGDLNPWKVVKKTLPGKLVGREKGQNLKPFLLKTLAQTLASPERIEEKSQKELDDTTPTNSGASLATNAVYSSVYGNNFEGICKETNSNSNDLELWTSSAFDSILLLFWHPLNNHFKWMTPIFSAIQSLCQKTIDSVVRSILGKVFEMSLSVSNLTYLVQHIQWSLFCNDAPWPTEQEMKMREELAMRRTFEFFQNNIPSYAQRVIGRDDIKTLVSRIIDALQYPRLNKQLLYVLIDRLLLQIFHELDESRQHPLQ
uniref:Sorting nexin-12 n=1 Tax=Caenorhabditis tropicalis TaxID=1561998 RepID=A0A1I7UUF1_9PELO